MTADTQAHAGSIADDSTARTVVYSYDYTRADRLSGIGYPDGEMVNYNYSSGLNNVLSRVSSVSDSLGTIQSYGYLGLDTPIQLSDGNGVTLNVGLDNFGRTNDQQWNNSSGTIDEQLYGYDQNSNVLYRDNTVSAMSSRSELYTYDSVNRRTNLSIGTMTISGGTASISSPAKSEGWNLNAVGGWNQSNTTISGSTTHSNRSNDAQNRGPWSRWGASPVSGFGATVYAILMGGALLHLMGGPANQVLTDEALLSTAFIAAGSIIWFVTLLAFVIRQFGRYRPHRR